jgi:hypothetical protein
VWVEVNRENVLEETIKGRIDEKRLIWYRHRRMQCYQASRKGQITRLLERGCNGIRSVSEIRRKLQEMETPYRNPLKVNKPSKRRRKRGGRRRRGRRRRRRRRRSCRRLTF